MAIPGDAILIVPESVARKQKVIAFSRDQYEVNSQ